MPARSPFRNKTDRVEAAVETLEGARRSSIAWGRYFVVAGLVVVALFWGGYLAATDLQRQVAEGTAAERSTWRAAAASHYIDRILGNAGAVGRFVLDAAESGASEEDLAAVLRGRAANNDALAEIAVCRQGLPVATSSTRGALVGAALCDSVLSADRPAPGKLQVTQPAPVPGHVAVSIESAQGCGGGRCASVVLLAAKTLVRVHDAAATGEATCIRLEDPAGTALLSWDATAGPHHAVAGPPGCRLASTVPMVAARRVVGQHPLSVAVETGVRQGSPATDLYLWICIVATGAVLGSAGLLFWLHRQHVAATRKVLRMRRRLRRAHERLEAQVAHRTRELERANQDLQAYGSRVAHDVKGPLVAIRAFAHALLPTLSRAGSDLDRQHLKRIQDSAQQMLDVADRLLLIGRVHGFEAPGEPVDIGNIARTVLEELAQRAGDGVTCSWHVEKGIIVPGDRTLLRQAIENLLTNAWKFSAPTGHVRIEVGCHVPERPGRCTFYVRDNGIGFDSKSAVGLFQPFARFHSSENHPGSGIGLAIVHRIVQLHGGSIRCESAPGRGAIFYVDLPLSESDTSSG